MKKKTLPILLLFIITLSMMVHGIKANAQQKDSVAIAINANKIGNDKIR